MMRSIPTTCASRPVAASSRPQISPPTASVRSTGCIARGDKGRPKLTSVGPHLRLIGRPAWIGGLEASGLIRAISPAARPHRGRWTHEIKHITRGCRAAFLLARRISGALQSLPWSVRHVDIGRSARLTDRRYLLRRRGAGTGPFPSLATGKVFRSWFVRHIGVRLGTAVVAFFSRERS
jgi:hypothetical protein